MKSEAKALVAKCEPCQYHSKYIKIPANKQIPISSAWPFDLWGIDIVGPFPTATRQRKFLIVAVEYFTKWVEAEALAKITAKATIGFIWKNIICRFGVPYALVSDNGTQFSGSETRSFLEGLNIQSHFSSVSHPASNGLAEVTNRTILEGLKRKVTENKKNWPDMLEEVLWAYRTTPREATGQTPYSLVYGMEAVTPLELVEPSMRMATYNPQDNQEARSLEMDLVDEAREQTRVRVLEYQRRIKKAFDKRVAPRHFQPGDLVIRKAEAAGKGVKKLDRAWEGPYRVMHSHENGSYVLQDLEGRSLARPWNIEHLRRFYV
jgi:hypothetical protein